MKYAKIQSPDQTAHIAEKSTFFSPDGTEEASWSLQAAAGLDEYAVIDEHVDTKLEIIVSTLSRLAAIPALALSVGLLVGFFARVI